MVNHSLWTPSCESVSLLENFVDRPESYDLFSAKSCIFLAHEKTCTVWGIFLHFHTQHNPKQGIKKFLRHFPTTLVPSLTLQISDIVQSSFERPALEFSLVICHIRDLDVWSRGKGKPNFVRLVMVRGLWVNVLRIFWYLALGQVVYVNGEIYPKPCAKNTQLLALNES
jgi:hypothetical protein